MIYLLTATVFLMAVLIITVLIRQRFSGLLMAVLIPFLIFNTGFTYHTISELWGYAKTALPREEVELLAYKIQRPDIYIMVREQSGRVRLHQIPYTKNTEDDLNGAGQQIKQGQRVMMRTRGHDGPESRTEFYNWRPAEQMPKERR